MSGQNDEPYSIDELMDYEPGPGELAFDWDEFIANMASKWWRINHLYWIVDEDGCPVLFRPNPAQEWFYNNWHYLNVLLKARQWGGTTLIDICILDECLFRSNLEAGIIAHNKEDAAKIFRRKIQFPYRRLPKLIKDACPLSTDSRTELALGNGSIIYVGTSMRSGTVQMLHVSELGKISRKYPDKAEEIKTGALNAVHAGNMVWIESSAEGAYGVFHDMVQLARHTQDLGKPLGALDWKFHFVPWFWHAEYRLSPEDARETVITAEMEAYFEELYVKHGIALDDNQKAWYVKKADVQGDKMFQEFPSTPDEPFWVSIEGAYYSKEMVRMRKQGRICNVPIDRNIPINTAWDLGRNDTNAIIFHQRAGREHRIVDYYKNSGESLEHYCRVLREKNYIYGVHYFPHDIRTTDYTRNKPRILIFNELMVGHQTQIIDRQDDAYTAGIDAVRSFLDLSWIDAVRCEQVVRALDNYQHEWDDSLGAFKSMPLHNWASHCADAMRTLAMGYADPIPKSTRRRQRTSYSGLGA